MIVLVLKVSRKLKATGFEEGNKVENLLFGQDIDQAWRHRRDLGGDSLIDVRLRDAGNRLGRQQVGHHLELARLFFDDDARNDAAIDEDELRVLKFLVDLARGIDDLLEQL